MIITSSHFNRPEFTFEMLKYLKNVKGIENETVIFSIDRDKTGQINEQVLFLLESFKVCQSEVIIASKNLGCSRNTLKLFTLGFLKSYDNLVFHIEDDVLIGHDSLDLIKDITSYNLNDDIATISLFNRTSEEQVGSQFHVLGKRPWFTPSGFVMRKEFFRLTVKNDCYLTTDLSDASWDSAVNKLRQSLNLYEIFPVLSRSNNIGSYGVHIPSKEWYEQNLKTKFWIEDVILSNNKFIRHF